MPDTMIYSVVMVFIPHIKRDLENAHIFFINNLLQNDYTKLLIE